MKLPDWARRGISIGLAVSLGYCAGSYQANSRCADFLDGIESQIRGMLR